MAANSKTTVKVVRSATTGRFVPKGRAKTSPKTTVTETIRR
ncbi:MAG TPA: hypothetical protein VD706_00035 [Candidatus Saccharimonadales bacterium]|nr:hypothetical protein [Candidatus Saccharimonadales bacterium]